MVFSRPPGSEQRELPAGPPRSPTTSSGGRRAWAIAPLLGSLLVALLGACGGEPTPPGPPEQGDVLWNTYLSSSDFDVATAVAAHVDGGVVVAGTTNGSLGGASLGFDDIVLARIDADGNVVWLRQLGGPNYDGAQGVASDALGNSVVVGRTGTDLLGGPLDHYDAFVSKHDASGDLIWARLIGGYNTDEARAVAIDPDGNVFVGGWTQNSLEGTYQGGDADPFVLMYDSTGTVVWTKQFGTTAQDSVRALATADNGLLLVAGYTGGEIGSPNAGPAGTFDAFVRLYNPSGGGQVLWTRQFGTAQDEIANAVAFDNQRLVVVAGYTNGSLTGVSNGSIDAFVRKYHVNGTLLWTRQFGTSGDDIINAVAIDADDNIIVVGSTNFDLAGPVGMIDSFIRVYDPDGNELWTRQFGGPVTGNTDATGVAVDSDGTIVVVGRVATRFDGTAAPGTDMFIRSYVP